MRCINQFVLAFLLISSNMICANSANAFSLFGKHTAQVDPPSRVARLSYTNGSVSFSPAAAKNNVWVIGRVNRPFVAGDRIWSDKDSRAELQLGNAAVRLNDNTSLRVINLNDQIAQFDLPQGSIILHVRSIKSGQTYEIDTPQLAFRVTQTGDYRINVSEKGDATIVAVRKGNGFAYAKNSAYKIDAPQTYRFIGKNLQAQAIKFYSLDKFDKWSQERETRAVKSRSVKYVSITVIGYEDLDNYGNWRYTAEYGYVWSPSRAPSGWAPYRYGHWSWIDPWGWTWIDDQPWGFAPSHYGRWAHYNHTWVWIPGPRTAQSTYAPALVVFIGGNKHHIEINSNPAIAWFPLGPRDIYVPPYKTSKTYLTNVNVTNTTINQTQITNVYKNNITQVNYTNYQVNNAITAVPTKTFVQAESTAKVAMPVTPVVISQAPITPTAVVTAEQKSVTGTQVTTTKPAETTLERVPVVVTTPPSSGEPALLVTPPAETNIPVISAEPPQPATGPRPTQAATVEPVKAPDVIAAETDKKVADEKAKAEKTAADAKAKADAGNDAEKKAAESENAAREKAEADKQAAEAEKAAAEKADADKQAAEAAKQAAAEAESQRKAAETEKQAAEQAESERRAEAERQAKEAEKTATAEHEAAQRAEAEHRAEAERQAAEQERAEAERQQAAERQAAERAEAEKTAAAAAESQRQAAEAAKAEAERAAVAKAEAEANAKAEAEQKAAEATKAEAEEAAAAAQAPTPAA